ncbi:MAG: hypothetical protein WA374_19715 [Acidobacteriaceae bacterium]
MMLLALLACTVALPAQVAASGDHDSAMKETECPWLTVGTAADVLGGDVTVTVAGNSNEGSCRFVRREATVDFLEIRVSAGSLHGCPSGSAPLRGVGNEAERCRIADARGLSEEMASGSVRAVHFTVTISGRAARTSGKPSDSSDDALARIADEVAGNLY